MKGGRKFEINDEFLDEILHKNDLKMDLAMQLISNGKTIRNDTIQFLKNFNSQSLTTQAKRGEQLVFMMPAIKKAFNLMGDDKGELATKKCFEKKNRIIRWKMAGRI